MSDWLESPGAHENWHQPWTWGLASDLPTEWKNDRTKKYEIPSTNGTWISFSSNRISREIFCWYYKQKRWKENNRCTQVWERDGVKSYSSQTVWAQIVIVSPLSVRFASNDARCDIRGVKSWKKIRALRSMGSKKRGWDPTWSAAQKRTLSSCYLNKVMLGRLHAGVGVGSLKTIRASLHGEYRGGNHRTRYKISP